MKKILFLTMEATAATKSYFQYFLSCTIDLSMYSM